MICRNCKDRADAGDRIHQPCTDRGCLCQHGEPLLRRENYNGGNGIYFPKTAEE